MPGILMPPISSVPSPVSKVMTEKSLVDSLAASAAAIFMGWSLVIALPWMSPLTAVIAAAAMSTQAPNFVAQRQVETSSTSLAAEISEV